MQRRWCQQPFELKNLFLLTIMPRNLPPLNELGGIHHHHDSSFCARVRYRNEAGVKVIIRGPDRADKQRAESDLQRMRAAGQIGKTREQSLEIMTAEAMRIKTDAKYQADIDAAAQSLDAQEEEGPAPSEDEPSEEDPWLKDYSQAPTLSTTTKTKPFKTPNEATAALRKFRPIREDPQALEHILSGRADPNFVADDDITVLRKVLMLAREDHVADMRELLLKHGAEENDFERERWRVRQAADACERVRLQNASDIEELSKIQFEA